MRRIVYVIGYGGAPKLTYLCGRGRDRQLHNKNGLVGFTDDVFTAHKFVSKGQAEFFLDKHRHAKWDVDARVLRVTFEAIHIDELTVPTARIAPQRQEPLSFDKKPTLTLVNGGKHDE